MARGSIWKREAKDGRTTYYAKWRDGTGRQVKRSFATKGEAERALASALAGAAKGERHAPTRETFADYAERWLAEHRHRVEPSSAVDYENTIRNHLIPFFGQMRLSAITTEDVRAYIAGKQDGTAPVREQPKGRGGRIKIKPSVKTINNQVGLIGLMLGHAAADGLIARNPAEGKDRRRPLKLKEPHRESDYLRPSEIPVYLDAATAFWRPRAMTLILTGVRIGELLALEWGDVDWSGRAIVVSRALKDSGRVGSTKGDEVGRRVDVGPSLMRELREHAARQAEHDPAWDEGLVFPAQAGGYDNAQRVLRYEHRPALKRGGLRTSLRNHDLRQTSAALWLSLGFGLPYVQRQMGHRSIETTVRKYGHLEPSLIPDAAARVEAAALGSAGTTAVPRA